MNGYSFSRRENKNLRRGASLAEVFYSLSSLTASAAMFSTVMPF